MKHWLLACAVVAGAASAAQAQGNDADYRAAVSGAARELLKEIYLFQDAYLVDGTPPDQKRGIFKQSVDARMSLTVFKQQLQNKASRDELFLAFDKVDRQLEGILTEIKPMIKWNAGLGLAARRVKSALDDLHFAVCAGDAGPARPAQALYRQTLALQDKAAGLKRAVDWIFLERPPLAAWTADVKQLSDALVSFQKLQQTKEGPGVLKNQFAKVEQIWDGIYKRYQGSEDQLLLQPAVAALDQGLARLAPLFGVKDRRAPLSANLFD